MSNTYATAKSINITKPTYDEPSLRIRGSGTYKLRSTFHKNLFFWNSKEKLWEKEFFAVEGVTTADLENAALPLIDDITIAASLEGIHVNVTSNSKIVNKSDKNTKPPIMDYESIKNTNKTYPDGTKMHSTTTRKYFHDFSFDSDGEEKPDTIYPTLNNDRIELRGSTYYNREWLKSTLDARFDKVTRLWYIANGDNHILKQIERILTEFGIAKVIGNRRLSRNRNKNKKSRNIKRLKRRRISTSSEEESESSDGCDIEIIESGDKYPRPALKRRRIMEESDDESILEIDADSDDLHTFVVADDSIEYVPESESESDSQSEDVDANGSNVQDMSQDNTNNNSNVNKLNNTNVKVDENKKKADENEADDQENECIICFDAKKEYVCVPCGHLCLCGECKDSVKECPMCRAKLASVIKLFK